MKLKPILIKVLEGICSRKDGENDEDYITRCGTALTYPSDYKDNPTPYSMKNPIPKRYVKEDEDELNILGTDLDETNNTKPSSQMRPEPHPTRHEIEHPPYEKDAFNKNKKK